ncbi:MAG TPA: glycosyltransferase family 9 protein [Pilimelia sp.]|nr:glycosyltransferase family 9 protein [Pilimelia sp.]
MILALRALGVGDLATAVPALRGLRAAFPAEPLALAAPRWLAPLVDLIGGVDRLLPTDGLGPRAWPGRPPRLAVNLHGRGPQSHRLLAGAGADRMLAFACPRAGYPDGPVWRSDEHEVARWCRMLAWYGVPCDPADLALRRPPGHHSAGLTIIHPGAKAPQRRWPPERFAEVARELGAAGHRVVVTGSAGERGLAADVAGLAGLPERAVLAGRTDMGELAGVVAGARLLISGDTGIGHLATAYGTPSVLLFGPVSPALWGPPPDRPQHVALWHGQLRPGEPWPGELRPGEQGGPAGSGVHPALLAVTVAEVLAAAAAAQRAATADGGRRARQAVAAP